MTIENLEIEVTADISKAVDALERLKDALSKLNGAMNNGTIGQLANSIRELNKSLSALDPKIVDRYVKLADALGKLSAVSNINIRVSTLADASRQAERLNRNLERVNTHFTKFFRMLSRQTVYRAIRQGISAIFSGIGEAMKNAYLFAKGAGEPLSELVKRLDALSSASRKATNQIGAAFLQMLAAIEPILIKIIKLVTNVMTFITQLFAVISGQSYYEEAADATREMYENTAGGAAAAKEWKNQLMGFDELNVLNEPSSGGSGGGGAANNFKDMFKSVQMSDELIAKLKRIAEIAGVVAAIIAGISLYNAIQSAGGLAAIFSHLSTLLKSIFNPKAIGLGLILAGVFEIGLGIYEWVKAGELTDEAFRHLLLGLGLLAGAVLLFGGGWLAIIPIVAAVALAIYKYWDQIKEFGVKAWTAISSAATSAWGNIKSAAASVINAIIDGLNWIIQKFNALNTFFGGTANFVPSIGHVGVGQYATGGYPSEGELFIAREAGAEMVGSIGGHTAVANNEQIVAAVSRGVYEAVRAAMPSQGGGEYRFYLDGKELAANVTKHQRMASRAMG